MQQGQSVGSGGPSVLRSQDYGAMPDKPGSLLHAEAAILARIGDGVVLIGTIDSLASAFGVTAPVPSQP